MAQMLSVRAQRTLGTFEAAGDWLPTEAATYRDAQDVFAIAQPKYVLAQQD
jgi:hypothetical protein